MQKLVLLVVGAVWVAVLVPPLLRSRGENRPHSSVDMFRRNLSVLQKTTPSRVHVQAMGRPLAGGQGVPDARTAARRAPSDPRLRRTTYDAATRAPGDRTTSVQRRQQGDHTANLQRRAEAKPHNRRELQRKRREQVVRILLFLSVTTGILALLAKSPMLIYACAICVLSLIGYCAMLLRLRREAELYALDTYQRAA